MKDVIHVILGNVQSENFSIQERIEYFPHTYITLYKITLRTKVMSRRFL